MTWYNQGKRNTLKEEIQEPLPLEVLSLCKDVAVVKASGDGGLLVAHRRVVLMGSRKPCKQCG